jgi:hypothetical protein
MTMPPNEKVHGLTQKYAFRNAIRGYVPRRRVEEEEEGCARRPDPLLGHAQ